MWAGGALTEESVSQALAGDELRARFWTTSELEYLLGPEILTFSLSWVVHTYSQWVAKTARRFWGILIGKEEWNSSVQVREGLKPASLSYTTWGGFSNRRSHSWEGMLGYEVRKVLVKVCLWIAIFAGYVSRHVHALCFCAYSESFKNLDQFPHFVALVWVFASSRFIRLHIGV